jgi:hypothetical protein
MARETLSMPDLIDLLEREFQRFRATECVMLCRVPVPVFREARAPGEANWHIASPLACARHCHRLIEAVVARLAGAYDLEPPPANPQGTPTLGGRAAPGFLSSGGGG